MIKGLLSILDWILTVSFHAAIFCAALFVLIGILWDTDYYEFRDDYEHTKVALLDDWDADSWCPPGRKSKACEDKKRFEKTFSDIDDFTFFKFSSETNLNITIITGVSFSTARDVMEGNPKNQWCYTTLANGTLTQQVQLGAQEGRDEPEFINLDQDTSQQLIESGINPDELMRAAARECWFNKFKLIQQQEKHNG